MRAFRLAPERHPPFNGEGARRFGGRWNSPGVPLVYLSEHLSVAVLETLVHQDRAHLPADLVAWEVEIPDVLVETVAEIPDAWFADPLRRQTRRFGDSWAAETRTLALRLPSAVIRWEHNVLLNPLHPDTPRMQPLRAEPFEFDSRLGT